MKAMNRLEELFGKEFAEKIENTRDNVQTYNDLRMIDDQINRFAEFIENSGDKTLSFNCRINVVNNSSDDDYDDYMFYTSGKEDCTSNIRDQVDFVDLTPEEKKQFNELCAKLVVRHIEHLFGLRKKLSNRLGETE